MKKYSFRSEVPEKVQKELEVYPELMIHLLYHRGIETVDKAHEFLNPDYEEHTQPGSQCLQIAPR